MASRVYVIELSPAVGKRRDPRLPWVYVGSTGRRIATRFEQHKSGYKSSGIVKRHWLRLRPDLYEDLKAFPGSKTALAGEQARARELARCGFVAHCDGTSYGHDTMRSDWTEWDAARLEPVRNHLDAAIVELHNCCFRAPSADELAHLLYGTRAFWVEELLDQQDPPPSFGLFPHVQLGVLRERVQALQPASAAAG